VLATDATIRQGERRPSTEGGSVTGYVARLREQDDAHRRAVLQREEARQRVAESNRWQVLQVQALRLQRVITRPGKAPARAFAHVFMVASSMFDMLPAEPRRVVLARQTALLAEVDRDAEARAAARRRSA
jgi:hypothetical protein